MPHPGRFCLHKLALFALRTGADNPKRQKDVLQAALLASTIAGEQEFLLVDAIKGMDSKMRAKVRPGVARVLALLKDPAFEAAHLLEPLA